jgi:hypothetical protein
MKNWYIRVLFSTIFIMSLLIEKPLKSALEGFSGDQKII